MRCIEASTNSQSLKDQELAPTPILFMDRPRRPIPRQPPTRVLRRLNIEKKEEGRVTLKVKAGVTGQRVLGARGNILRIIRRNLKEYFIKIDFKAAENFQEWNYLEVELTQKGKDNLFLLSRFLWLVAHNPQPSVDVRGLTDAERVASMAEENEHFLRGLWANAQADMAIN